MLPTPIALPPALPSELLEYALAHQAYPTALIICTPRATFLSSLLAAVEHTTPHPQEPVSSPIAIETDSPAPPDQASQPPLLMTTLHQIAISRYITTSFIPTVSHLRAYLSIFPAPSKPPEGSPPAQRFDRPGTKVPLLVTYGLLELHRDTTEWSAQGLSTSLAALVEAGMRTGRRVVVLEQRALEAMNDGATDYGGVRDEEGGEELGGVDWEERGKVRREIWKGWKERVPILNGGVRRAGLSTEDGGWSGRTVEVGRVFGRWFKLGRGDWEADNLS